MCLRGYKRACACFVFPNACGRTKPRALALPEVLLSKICLHAVGRQTLDLSRYGRQMYAFSPFLYCKLANRSAGAGAAFEGVASWTQVEAALSCAAERFLPHARFLKPHAESQP